MAEEKKTTRAVAKKSEAGMVDYLANALSPFKAEKADLLNPAEVEERVLAYFASCGQRDIMPVPPGVAAWLGVSQDEFRRWLEGMGSTENRQLASRVHQMLHQVYAEYSVGGRLSPQLSMFFGQNWFGYQNKNAVELQQAQTQKADLDALAAEAAALPDGEVIDASFVEIESAGKVQKGTKGKPQKKAAPKKPQKMEKGHPINR